MHRHPSYFVGLLLRGTSLPYANFGHVVLAKPSPILFYPISSTEVLMCPSLLVSLLFAGQVGLIMLEFGQQQQEYLTLIVLRGSSDACIAGALLGGCAGRAPAG